MIAAPDYLDALTSCLLNIFSLQSSSSSSDSWLSRSADEIRKVLLSDGIVTLVDVQGGSLIEPWSRTNLGISTYDPGLTSLWHEYFISLLNSQGINAQQIITEVNKLRYSYYSKMTTEIDIPAKIFIAFADKFNVIAAHNYTGPLVVHPWQTSQKRLLNLTLWVKNGFDDPFYNNSPETLMRNLWNGVKTCYVNALIKGTDHRQLLMARLTRAQKRVAELLLTGMSERQIAEKLGRTKYTIHDHIKAIYRAWEVRTRGEFMAKWATSAVVQKDEATPVAETNTVTG